MRKLQVIFYSSLVLFLLLGCEGDLGPSGENSLIKTTVENAGQNCRTGGIKIETGIDANRNNILDQNEVQTTQYLCNGLEGSNSLVNSSIVPPGADCVDGGIKLDIGVDLNRNGLLEQDEIQSTRYICNGSDGITVDQVRFQLISLVALSSGSTTGTLTPEWMYLRKFKKSDFSSLQSAILSGYISTQGDLESTCIVELFNLTDNIVIQGSTITTNSKKRVWVDSPNFLENIPDKEIDLAIRLRTNIEGGNATCTQAYLILSKK